MNSKLEKFLKPQEYRKKKVAKFLHNIANVTSNFEEFKGKTREDCVKYIYGNGKPLSGAKAIAEAIDKQVITPELEKNIDFQKTNKNYEKSSYKYLLAIKNACSKIPDKNNSQQNLGKSIEALEKLQRTFDQASRFSDTAKISFLSDKKVKEYMKTQSKNLKDSINAMEEILFNT